MEQVVNMTADVLVLRFELLEVGRQVHQVCDVLGVRGDDLEARIDLLEELASHLADAFVDILKLLIRRILLSCFILVCSLGLCCHML